MHLLRNLPRNSFAAISILGFSKAFPFAARSAMTTVGGATATTALGLSANDKDTTNVQPYGSWESPITAKFITGSSVGMGSLKADHEGNLFWIEGRSQEAGRQVICKYLPDHTDATERGGVDQVDKVREILIACSNA